MKRTADRDLLEAAALGGTVLSAGAGGEAWLEAVRSEGSVALAYGPVEIVDLDDLPDDALVVTVSSVGAPSAGRSHIRPVDRVEAARSLIDETGTGVLAVMISEATTVNGWLQAAALGLVVVDAAGDGRGHPTVEMGSLGLNDVPTVQTAVVGGERPLRVVARGTLADTSKVLRQAAAQAGGLIACARMPLPVKEIRQRAALGAVSYQIGLGEVMKAHRHDPASTPEALAAHAGGAVLAGGRVVSNTVTMTGAFDVGEVVIDTGSGRLRLPVVNEFMAAWRGGERLSLFPDLLAVLSPDTGLPVAVKDLAPGVTVAVLHVPKERLPTGQGARDERNLKEVEAMSGLSII